MNELTPELENEFDKLKMQLRGYEVARETDRGWDVVKTTRPTDLGRYQAIKDTNFLNWKHPLEKYRVRPVVSIDVDFARKTSDLDGALVKPNELEEFREALPEEPLLLTGDNLDLEATLAMKRDNDAGGFVTPTGVVPFDYASAANDAPLPEGF